MLQHRVVFSNRTGKQLLLFLPPPTRMDCWPCTLLLAWEGQQGLCSPLLYAAAIMHSGNIGHLLRCVASYNKGWAREYSVSLFSHLNKRWKMTHSNAYVTCWRQLLGLIFHFLSLSSPLPPAVTFLFSFPAKQKDFFTWLLESITWVLGYVLISWYKTKILHRY